MPSNVQPRTALVWLLALALVLPAMAQAAGDELATGDEAVASATHTYALNGVTITWDLETQRFRAPTAAEAARIAEEFNRMMAERFAHGQGALAPADSSLEVRTLPNGTKMVRVPVNLLNASIVRVDGAGEMQNLCLDGPAQAGATLSAPANHPLEVK